MTQEDKELLLKDLCARLPYGVKVTWDGIHPLTVTPHVYCSIASVSNLPKLLLRPMSSMTEEEEKEYAEVVVKSQDCSYKDNESATTMVNDWYLSKGFDVRGLIPKGLALEAQEGMY
jgi:hypothetical protein